jgi:hypothetical protein
MENAIVNDVPYPKFNQQKATEAAMLLIQLHGGRMSRLKLVKLIYLADRKALEKWERPITYDAYFSMGGGQVLSGVLDLINNNIINPLWQAYIEQAGGNYVRLSNNAVKPQKLSRAEVKLLQDIYKQFGHWYRFDLGDYTKKLPEYKPTTGRIRTYIQDILDKIYSKDDTERIVHRLEEKAYLDMALED